MINPPALYISPIGSNSNRDGEDSFILMSQGGSISRCLVDSLLSCNINPLYIVYLMSRPIDVSSLVTSHATISFSSNHLAIGGFWDSTIKIYSVIGGDFVQSLSGHNDTVTCVAFSARGNVLVSGAKDARVIVFQLSSDSSYKIKRTLYGHSTPLIAVDVNEDVDSIVSCSVIGFYLTSSARPTCSSIDLWI
jgi:WD40 repeat protein